MSSRNTKLYISGLGPTVQQKELFDLFARHGKIIGFSVKNNFAFVEFSHPDDADDAIRGLDGFMYHGKKLRVQIALPKSKQGSPSRDSMSPYSRTRIYVGGLTEGINMRELEEVFSEVGHVVRTVDKKSFAFLEYESSLHAEKAIKRFDGTDFMGRRLIVNFATIPFHSRAPGYHSPRRGRSRSPSRSPSRGRKRLRYSSLSRSRSRSRSLSRSPTRYSRSRSRSPRGWDRGRGGRDRRGRGRSRDYSPYFRSWSRSTSGSSSDSSRSRSRSRSPSKSPISSHSSSSPSLNSPPFRTPHPPGHHANGTIQKPDTTHPPTPVEAPSTQPPSEPHPIITSLPPATPTENSVSESNLTKSDETQPPSGASTPPPPSSPPAVQDMVMSEAIKSEQPTDSSSTLSTSQEPPKWEPLVPTFSKSGTSILGPYPPNLSALLPTPPIPPAYPIPAHIPMPVPTTPPQVSSPTSTIQPTIATSPSASTSPTTSQPSTPTSTPTPTTPAPTLAPPPTPASPTSTSTSTPTPTPTPTAAPIITPITTPTPTPTPTPTSTQTPTPTSTPMSTSTPMPAPTPAPTPSIPHTTASPSSLTSSAEIEQRSANFENKEKEREKEKEKELRDKEPENKEIRDRDNRDYRDPHSRGGERDRERDRERDTRDYRDRERDRDYRRRYTERGRTDYPTSSSSSSSYHSTSSSTQDRKPEREPGHTSMETEETQKESEIVRVNGVVPATSTTTPDVSSSSSAPSVQPPGNKDALEQVLSNLFKTRDAMMKGIDGVFGELQRRNQLFSQLISREEARNKEIDGLRAELVNVKKDLVAKNEMGCRRIESEIERRLALLERKVVKAPEDDKSKGIMSQESFLASLNNTLTPICASLDATFKMIADTRNEQQVLKNEMRLVLDALRADVHGSREAVLVKLENTFNELRAPMGQLVANEAQNARLIDSLRSQMGSLQQQVAGVAQTQQNQQAQPPPPPQEPVPSFAGQFGKKMFPVEGLTSKVSLLRFIDQKIDTLETNLTKQFSELKNEVLTQGAIRGMITEDKKAVRTTRKKGSGSAV